jgi:hypothetical protein
MFADNIRDIFLNDFRMWLEADKPTPSPHAKPHIQYKYLMYKRFYNMYSFQSVEELPHAPGIYRRLPSVNSDIGPFCSGWIAKSIYPSVNLIRKNTMKWKYELEDYAPILRQLLPRPAKFVQSVIPHDYPNIVAIQFFLFCRDFLHGKAVEPGFHTLCAFRYNDRWFIGDNMAGIATPIPDATIEGLVGSSLYHMSISAAVPATAAPNAAAPTAAASASAAPTAADSASAAPTAAAPTAAAPTAAADPCKAVAPAIEGINQYMYAFLSDMEPHETQYNLTVYRSTSFRPYGKSIVEAKSMRLYYLCPSSRGKRRFQRTRRGKRFPTKK